MGSLLTRRLRELLLIVMLASMMDDEEITLSVFVSIYEAVTVSEKKGSERISKQLPVRDMALSEGLFLDAHILLVHENRKKEVFFIKRKILKIIINVYKTSISI